MNIFNKLTTIISSFILFSPLVLGENNKLNNTCLELDSLLLCENVDACPDNYHVCNTFDTDILLKNEKNFYNIKNSYATNIGSNNEKCELCSTNLYNNLITIEPYSDYSEQPQEYCMIDNKKIKSGNGIKISKCVSCICDNAKTTCLNSCVYNKKNYLISNIDTGLTNCVGLKKTNTNDLTCIEYARSKNKACCVDNACYLKNCKSCMRFGDNEICNECDNGYYFNSYSTNKCHNLEQIKEICDYYYSLDSVKKTFNCLKCENGVLQYDEKKEENICICDKGYYGSQCDKNYNIIKCNGNGVYNIDTNKCSCYGDFEGEACEKSIKEYCVKGFYSKYKQRCICNYGYKGENCDERIKCVYGKMLLNTCLCHSGFSGESCEVPFQETYLMKHRKEYRNILIGTYNLNPCKNGILINNKCVCFMGYTGSDCGKSKCEYGNYNKYTNSCDCIEGYYGEKCNFNCYQKCSYNGNMCTKDNIGICKCNNGWYGRKCEFFKNFNYNKNYFYLTNSIKIKYVSKNFNFIAKIIENRIFNSFPFKINRIVPNRLFINRKRNLLEKNNSILIINTSIGLVNPDDVYYIYPDNNYYKSYYSGKIINITISEDSINDFFIYVERNRTNNYISSNSSLINNTQTNVNIALDINQIEEETNLEKLKNYLVNNYLITSCLIFGLLIIASLIIKRLNNKTKNNITNKNILLERNKNEHYSINVNVSIRNNLNKDIKIHHSNPLFSLTKQELKNLPINTQSLIIYKKK
jgi:hypothetical protein